MSEELFSEEVHAVKGLAPAADRWNTGPATDIVSLVKFRRATFLVHQEGVTTGKATLTVEACSDVSASATTAPGFAHTHEGKKPYVEARALRLDEIPRLIEDYAKAARNAMAAGFDGVQIHSANGYLLDQFLRENSNLRDDDYGGPVENRIRLTSEVTQAVVDAIGADRTSVRLSPNGETQGCDDSDPVALFTAAAAALQKIGISFLELREQKSFGDFGATDVPPVSPAIRKVFTNPLVLNQEYTLETAQADIASGLADAISFGRPFISNPDLVSRLRQGAQVAPDNFTTWYSPGPEGYTDYPTLETAAA
jgi:2,4-dienoyl-CoA reductase-like NADH-dependent reductase (Old Yellow Enzyme family)